MQSGLEWTLHWRTNKSSDFFSLELWNTGSINNHRFDDYVSNGTILNENRLPGVPLSQLNSGVNMQYKAFAISVIDYWMDRMPLNNTNTQWSNPYHLMNVMANWDLKLWGNLDCRLHAGVNNLFNTNYSSFLNLNAAASKFYNPSAPRNTFFGVRINYTIPMK
jgi:iron complex outermembrane receptor protein